MHIFPSEVQESHLDILLSIADGFIHETSVENLRSHVSDEFGEAKLTDYVKAVTRPSQIPEIRPYLRLVIASQSTSSVRSFNIAMKILSLRIFSPALTNSTKLITEMDDEEKRQLLLSWRDSPLEMKNMLFSLFCRLAVLSFTGHAPDIHFQAMDFPRRESRDEIYDGYAHDPFEYTMKMPPESNNAELYLPEFDAVIIGSGAGAGVVAHTLARDGHKCLVLEKGRYFKPSELNFDDAQGYKSLYENGGMLSTENSQMIILAGATFGGGTTVNWSACLETPFKVRSEWHKKHGLNFVATEEYDSDLDYVLKQMGASKDHITHSKSNQILLDGCAKLGYKVKEIRQNIGTHKSHSCGFCHLGCKWGVKQGSMVNWLRDAAANGTEFMDQVVVKKIIKNGKNVAAGIECVNIRNGFKFTIRGPKKYVLSGGSLQTPVLLQKSGFRNKHIGRNLKLHPVTTVFAFWDKTKSDPHHNSIMTTVCIEAEDLDGDAHGAKIETLLHTPFIETAFMPWLSSEKTRRDMLRYQLTSAFIVLTRDTLSGTVSFDPYKPDTLVIDYAINKFDRHNMAKAILVTMDVAYIEGATEIVHPYFRGGNFISTTPKGNRAISDPDYQKFRKHCAALELSVYGCGYGSAHQMSTCRMSGLGPSDGACDIKGRLYECDNVYVADASVMPTASGANPMVSTMALSRHIAKEICRDLKPASRL
ncbi:long-chain fatty alcohol dehydrogenase [Metschnikowia bicuspidata var. bicuspidata NRRL YB-4993]|uniref:Long-chain-alcohol oxidase n=1 Tax=Metschnikowia bicuspidata var. bicuspidata NRRL YB-4993 TaxID=869754 RepID=A0A1A0H5Y1_9ASCO|nr:long-chain fatty alcohol dehydrogenase [Metschnikowia bicuspidata var. bicuspidata NRRL YB-4993]OBA19494.1 long-chain fatty alcohol dehydrogenase [Metschnikowia bicuspidata var. bicuspidata NRRL YB-4993]